MSKREKMHDNLFIDRIHRLPRIWSNIELKKFAHLFHGDVANVSGWKDYDKEGNHYKDYFKNAETYTITNYKTEFCGYQGFNNEIFLDLSKKLPNEYTNKWDVIFSHTVLEHIFNVETAFSNICKMTKDIVILIVPFLQQMHSHYDDYWRFSPLAIKKLFEQNGMSLLYLNFNEHKNASVYIFSIATKKFTKWENIIHKEFSYETIHNTNPYNESFIGCNAIQNSGYNKKCVFDEIIRSKNIFSFAKKGLKKYLKK